MIKKISVIGGDLRSAKLAEMLVEDGFEVSTYGLENAYISQIEKCNTFEETIAQSGIIIGPIPLTTNGKELNMIFSNEKIAVDVFLNTIKNEKLLIAGNIKDVHLKIIEANNGKAIDILKREELAILNAISTAEGVIDIAIHETQKTLHSTNVLIMGYGKVGKVLAKMLDGIGANVYCEARKNVDLAWIKAFGYKYIEMEKLDENLGKFDIIVNTIPVMVLDSEKLSKVKKNCLMIDIASYPGGIDRNAAKNKGLRVIWALSLPGKTAPITSAEYIKDTIYNIIKEIG